MANELWKAANKFIGGDIQPIRSYLFELLQQTLRPRIPFTINLPPIDLYETTTDDNTDYPPIE